MRCQRDGTALRVSESAETGEELQSLSLSRGSCVDTALFSSDACLITHARETIVRLHDWRKKEEFGRLEVSSRLLKLAISPDRRRLATAGWNGDLQIWDLPSRSELVRHTAQWTSVFDLWFTRDGNRLILLSGGSGLWLWDCSREFAVLESSHENRGVIVAAALSLGVGDLSATEKDDFLFESVPESLGQDLGQRIPSADADSVQITIETLRRSRPSECYVPPSVLERTLRLPDSG